MRDYIDILGYDRDLKTIFARSLNGSVVLDIIPAAISHLQAHPEYETLYMQDYGGNEIILNQNTTLEAAVESWTHNKKKPDVAMSFGSESGIQPQL